MSYPVQAMLASELASMLGLGFSLDQDRTITAVSDSLSAGPSTLCFATKAKALPSADSSAIVIAPETLRQKAPDLTFLISKQPRLDFARALTVLTIIPADYPPKAIAASARIHPSATVAEGVQIAEHCVIAAGVRLAEGVSLGAGTVLEENVVLRAGVNLGEACHVSAGAVIGADGFGFEPSDKGWVFIRHLASVRIGHRVNIGANTTIDRGCLTDTVIGDGVKIDNQVQVAHNVIIGDHTVIAGQVAIGGSTRIGQRCVLAGACRIKDHVVLADQVVLTACTQVIRSITQAGVYSSGMMATDNYTWRRNHHCLVNLADLIKGKTC